MRDRQRSLPYAAGSETSKAAAEWIAGQAATQRDRVYAYLRDTAGGATDEEIQSALGMKVQSETPRRGELVDAGLVRDSGRKRKTSSGATATVWEAVPGGAAAAVPAKREGIADRWAVIPQEIAETAGEAETAESAPSAGWRCRCGSTSTVDVRLWNHDHSGRSTRRDCAACGRFVCFPIWYGKPTAETSRPEKR